jgi:lysophospholipase L1-like esterase
VGSQRYAKWIRSTIGEERVVAAKRLNKMNRTITSAVCLMLLLAGATLVRARSFSNVVVLSQTELPATDSARVPDDPVAAAKKDLENWRNSRAAMLRDDFGELAHYREANTRLKPAAAREKRVVFMGDSITEAWALGQYFPGTGYINRGISGQTTPQMLVRFREDVIDLQPSVVVILAGTNDIAGNTGPMSLEEIEANYASMAELARARGIRVVFSSIVPVHNYTAKAANLFVLRPMSKIRELNRWLQEYSRSNGFVYLDYFSAMIDEAGFLKKELADDGLHPNDAGYRVMVPLASEAIKKAFQQ